MDKRTLRTRQLLGKALAELLEEAPLHRITIRQITDRADVAYSTFFRNFETIEELLNSYIESFIKDVEVLSEKIEIDNFRETTQQNIQYVLEHVLKNQKMYHLILTEPALRPALEPYKKDLIKRKIIVAQSLESYFLLCRLL